MGQASEFSLSVEEYDINELEADITAPSGKSEPCILKKLPNGHLGKLLTAAVSAQCRQKKYFVLTGYRSFKI